MKGQLLKYALLCFLLAGWMLPPQAQKVTMVRNKHLERPVEDKQQRIVVESDFGNIHINSHDADLLKAEVEIKATGKNREKLKKLIRDIRIELTEENGTVYLRTRYPENTRKLFLGISYEVNYDVTVPKNNPLTLKGDFTNMNVTELYGPVKIESDYGTVRIGRLHDADNRISGDYVSRGSIGFVRGLVLVSDYSDWKIDMAFNVNAKTDYTQLYIKRVKNLRMKGDYNHLEVHRAKKMQGNTDYAHITVDKTYAFSWEGDYNRIVLNSLPPDFDFIRIAGDYNKVKILNPTATPYTYVMKVENTTVKQNHVSKVPSHETDEGQTETGYFMRPGAEAKIILDLYASQVIIQNNTKK